MQLSVRFSPSRALIALKPTVLLTYRQTCASNTPVHRRRRSLSPPSLIRTASTKGAIDPTVLRDGRYNGRPWSGSEDRRLREAVAKHGHDWKTVAAHVASGRTNRGCRQRWLLRLQDSVNRTPFTSAEGGRILQLCDEFPKQWTKVADMLGSGHSPDQVRDFVVSRRAASESYKVWTEREDGLLRAAVKAHGVGKWSAVAGMVPGRTDASCYSRWTFSLDPELVRGEWTAEEDGRLLEAVQALEKSGEMFHFGDVAVLMGNRRHRKSCRARYKRLMQAGSDEAAAAEEVVVEGKGGARS